MKNKLTNIIIYFGLIVFINNSYSYQDYSIIEGAKNFIKQQITNQYKTADLKTINIKFLNNKILDNKTCEQAINFSFPVYSTIDKKSTVIAECKDPNGWKIYIPVNIKFLANAIFAKKSLPKYHVISREDLMRQKINVLHLKEHYYTDPNDVIGLALKYPVKSNTVLTDMFFKEDPYDS